MPSGTRRPTWPTFAPQSPTETGLEAFQCGVAVRAEEDVVDVINQARAINDCPVVIDFIVGADARGRCRPRAPATRDPGPPAAFRPVRRLSPKATPLMSPKTHVIPRCQLIKPGVLARVAALFSRRVSNRVVGGATECGDRSRMTIVFRRSVTTSPSRSPSSSTS